ncbi:MAG: IS630 family transposase [Anaerolineae bacterium]|nr:IS630 family transposase [Anaerolineae bacterium]
MAQPLRLILLPEQRQTLESLRNTDPRPYVRERAAALLKIAAPENPASGRHVALHGLLKRREPDTVYRWVRRFQTEGVVGLYRRPGSGRKPAYASHHPTAEQAREALQHLLRRDPRELGEPRTRWTLASLRRVCQWLQGLTPQGVWQTLQRLRIHYKRGRDYIHSPDPDYLAKLRTVSVHAHAVARGEAVALLFQDELTYYRQPTLASAYEVAGPRQPLARRSYAANARWRVVATVDACTGRVLYAQGARIGVVELVRFYEHVAAVYSGARTIYVVQDNWPIHTHPAVLAALEPQRQPWPWYRPRHWQAMPTPPARSLPLPIQLLLLPTYAAWTNPIEKLWRWLKQEVMHLHRWAEQWEELKRQVGAFLEQFAHGSATLLRYVGLQDLTRLYRTALAGVKVHTNPRATHSFIRCPFVEAISNTVFHPRAKKRKAR